MLLAHELAQDPVHQPRRILGCIPLRERHRLVEDDLDRYLALVELLERDAGEVPVEVVLDEAVTLAKRYASEDAARLVNGILGRLVREEAR